VADELLRPSVIYTPAVLAVRAAVGDALHACAHITGGGIVGNLARILPEGTAARLERASWDTPRIFETIRSSGPVADDEMARVFNLGLGMVVALEAGAGAEAVEVLAAQGFGASIVGTVGRGSGEVEIG
jgi:phosphoribosylformylglycinamidine cyclo-ligase